MLKSRKLPPISLKKEQTLNEFIYKRSFLYPNFDLKHWYTGICMNRINFNVQRLRPEPNASNAIATVHCHSRS